MKRKSCDVTMTDADGEEDPRRMVVCRHFECSRCAGTYTGSHAWYVQQQWSMPLGKYERQYFCQICQKDITKTVYGWYIHGTNPVLGGGGGGDASGSGGDGGGGDGGDGADQMDES